MKPVLVATRPDSTSSVGLVTLQIFLPAVAFTLTVGVGSSANAGDEPATTRPEATMTEKTKRRIRSVSHAASRAGVTRGSTQVRAYGPPGLTEYASCSIDSVPAKTRRPRPVRGRQITVGCEFRAARRARRGIGRIYDVRKGGRSAARCSPTLTRKSM